jgi:hypothetical protein
MPAGECPKTFCAIGAFGLEFSQREKSVCWQKLTAAAGDGKGDDDAVADLQVFHARADFDDLAHEFVADDVAFFHRRHEAVVEMKIGAADRR